MCQKTFHILKLYTTFSSPFIILRNQRTKRRSSNVFKVFQFVRARIVFEIVTKVFGYSTAPQNNNIICMEESIATVYFLVRDTYIVRQRRCLLTNSSFTIWNVERILRPWAEQRIYIVIAYLCFRRIWTRLNLLRAKLNLIIPSTCAIY